MSNAHLATLTKVPCRHGGDQLLHAARLRAIPGLPHSRVGRGCARGEHLGSECIAAARSMWRYALLVGRRSVCARLRPLRVLRIVLNGPAYRGHPWLTRSAQKLGVLPRQIDVGQGSCATISFFSRSLLSL